MSAGYLTKKAGISQHFFRRREPSSSSSGVELQV
jgi:hypothetical protein